MELNCQILKLFLGFIFQTDIPNNMNSIMDNCIVQHIINITAKL